MPSPALELDEPRSERSAPGLTRELETYLTRHRKAVEGMVSAAGLDAGGRACRCRAKAVDGLLCTLFKAVQCTLTRAGNWPEHVILAAVGSYGRGSLALHSDLDVRLISGAPADSLAAIARSVLYPLRDGGLNVGHQVACSDELIELARRDLPTATALLDLRQIAGDGAAMEQLLTRAYAEVFGGAQIDWFLEALARSTAERAERYGDSLFLLEPDLRNGIGGLRDLDIAHWVARARFRVQQLSELVALGVLLPREWESLENAAEWQRRARNLLHLHAGCRSDRLSFEQQEQLASDLGYGLGGAAVEALMSEYYRQARIIEQCRERLLSRAAHVSKHKSNECRLEHNLKLEGDQVGLGEPSQLAADPGMALRVYGEAIRLNVPVGPSTRDAIARAAGDVEFAARLRAQPGASQLFVKLCTTVQRTRFKGGSVLRELHDVGLLTAMIPEFVPLIGRAQRDMNHIYTVDVQSIRAVDRLRELCRGELALEEPLGSRLAAEINRPNVLFFALLLHDIGKGAGGAGPSEQGVELVRGVLERLSLPEEQIREVQQLVLQQSRMYRVVTCRDIHDTQTLDSLCADVHGSEGLRELYLLTLCAIASTGPAALIGWKARMLGELYRAAEYQFGKGASAPFTQRLSEARTAVRSLADSSAESAFFDQFLQALPERYFYANAPTEIARHVRFARDASAMNGGLAALSNAEPYVELVFSAEDRVGLLAMITATLAAARLRVVSAQIYSWQASDGRQRALDLFWVQGAEGVQQVLSLLPRLERDFRRLLDGETTARALVAESLGGVRPARRTPEIRTEISIDNRCSSQHSVIEITTKDRPSLLFRLADTLQELGLTISLAKLNTEGSQVADVFYVAEARRRKILEPARLEQIKGRIQSALNELENEHSA